MADDLKKIIDLVLSDQQKNKDLAGAVLSSKTFNFFCIFIEYFAIRAKEKIKKEPAGSSFVHAFKINNKSLSIKTEFEEDEQKFYCFVYLNDKWRVSLMENKNRFILQSLRPRREEILKELL